MPKIIENLRSKLLEQARLQIEQAGYSAMTIRSVAKGCGVSVGTVYNYFPSKEHLVAAFMLEDWNHCMERIQITAGDAQSPSTVLRCIYDQLKAYTTLHSKMFSDPAAIAGFFGTAGRYHAMLRSCLAKPLRRFCQDDFTADFVAEALLTWTVSGKSYEEIAYVVQKLF